MKMKDASFERAENFDEQGLYKEAIILYKESLINSHEKAKNHARIGRCLQKLNQFQEAVVNFTLALDLKQDSPTTLYMRAQCYENLSRINEALADYLHSAEILPRPDVYINIGLIYKFKGNKEGSLKAFQNALKFSDCDKDLVNNLMKGLD